MATGYMWRTEAPQSASALTRRQGAFCQSRHCRPKHRHSSALPSANAKIFGTGKGVYRGVAWLTGHVPYKPSLSESTRVHPVSQVPRAPSSCTVVFGPAKDGEADSPLVSEWSVHGEDRSQSALHIMPEWVEVPPLRLTSLTFSSSDKADHEGSQVLYQVLCSGPCSRRCTR